MTNELEESLVKAYMWCILGDHTDPRTGEINTTSLAEDACGKFDGYGPPPEYEIPEEYFDWAFEVVEEDQEL